MHPYTIDSHIRQRFYLAIAAAALATPGLVACLSQPIAEALGRAPSVTWPLGFGATYGLLFLLLDRVLWKYAGKLHAIPNLNGDWEASGLTSFQPAQDGSLQTEFSLNLRIRQSFTRIAVFAETKNSTSQSTMAAMASDDAISTFNYVFENRPKATANTDLQPHPGLICLRIAPDQDRMVGDYFSGKHRQRFGELTLIRKVEQ